MTETVKCFEMANLDAGCCPWALVASCSSTGLERRGWKVSCRIGPGMLVTASWMGACSVPRWARRPTAHDLHQIEWSAGAGRELFSCMQWWWGCTLRAVFSLASQHEKVIELLECIQRRAMKLLKKLENDMWGNWGCLAQQRGGWEQTSLLSVIAWKEVVVKRVVVCFLTWQMTEHEEMVSSCAGGGLDCCHEEILPAVQWLGNGRGSPVQWWNCHPQMFLRDVWMWYSVM